jgi:hypothetical protein
MDTATNLVMGYKAILYGPIARNNLKTALWKINTYVVNDTGSRAGHDVQQKLEPPRNHTWFLLLGRTPASTIAFSCLDPSPSEQGYTELFCKATPVAAPRSDLALTERMERVKKYARAHHITTEYIDTTGTPWGVTIRF